MPRLVFIGREREQELYQEFLRGVSPWILAITGLGGSGKSTLLSCLRELTPLVFCVVKYDFAAQARSSRVASSTQVSLPIDPLTILEEFADQARKQCDPSEYETFKDIVKRGRMQLSEQRMQIIQSIHVGNEAVLEGGRFHINIDRIDETVRQVHHQIRELVTRAFYELMDTFTTSGLVILLDTCEWLTEPVNWEVGSWIVNEFVPKLRDHMRQKQKQVYLVTASIIQLELKNVLEQDILELELSQLDEGVVKHYFQDMGICDKELRDRIYEMTYGNATCVSIIARLWKEMPISLAELPVFRRKFNEYALRQFIDKHILDERLKAPFDELARYGVLLRSFTRPMLKEVFCEQQELQDTHKHAMSCFRQFVNYFYIKNLGNYRYALLDLLREILADAIRRQEPEKWERYHQRALKYLQLYSKLMREELLTDWHYHSMACKLTYDEEQDVSDWLKILQEAKVQDESFREVLDAASDKTFMFTSVAHAIHQLEYT